MNEQLKKVSKEGVIANFLVYVYCDQIERLRMFSDWEMRKVGLTFNKRDKILLDQIKYSATDLRKGTRSIDEQAQIDFGDTSDSLLKIVLLTLDRAGENKSKYEMICNFIESINSEQNLNLKMFKL